MARRFYWISKLYICLKYEKNNGKLSMVNFKEPIWFLVYILLYELKHAQLFNDSIFLKDVCCILTKNFSFSNGQNFYFTPSFSASNLLVKKTYLIKEKTNWRRYGIRYLNFRRQLYLFRNKTPYLSRQNFWTVYSLKMIFSWLFSLYSPMLCKDLFLSFCISANLLGWEEQWKLFLNLKHEIDNSDEANLPNP